jgi:hypothetical protein
VEKKMVHVQRAVQRIDPSFRPKDRDSSDEEETKTIEASPGRLNNEVLSPPGPHANLASHVNAQVSMGHSAHTMHFEPVPGGFNGHDVLSLHDFGPQMSPRPESDDPELDREPGPPVKPEQPKLVINHRTKASLLLEWPAIDALCGEERRRLGVKYVTEFPIRQEEKRGLIRLFGYGEGLETRLGARESENHGMLDNASDEAKPASPPSDCWGGIGSTTPVSSPDGRERPFKVLDFNEEDVWRYVQSYKDNIQNMHPIIHSQDLQYVVQRFLEREVGKRGNGRYVYPAPTPNTSAPMQDSTGFKRKRSPEADNADDYASASRGVRPQRSIQTAIVLLVLALGKICLVSNSKLPNVVPAEERIPFESPHVRNGILAPSVQSSPPAPSQPSTSSGLPSPQDYSDRPEGPRRTSQYGSSQSRPGLARRKNMEVIPGLDYFAYATDILGNHTGGHSLPHVYACLLAGLYHGQLGRVLESYHYIARASLTLHGVLRP